MDRILARLAARQDVAPEGRLPPETEGLAQQAVEQVLPVLAPRGVWRVAGPVSRGREELSVPGLTIQCVRWAGLAARTPEARLLLLFCCTLGPGVDALVRDLQAGSLALGYVADAAASEAASLCAEDLTARAFAFEPALAGLAPSRLFAPGYCGWPLTAQKQFPALLPLADLGVCLADSGAMLPAKTVTAAALAAPRWNPDCPCPRCPETACPYRRIP